MYLYFDVTESGVVCVTTALIEVVSFRIEFT